MCVRACVCVYVPACVRARMSECVRVCSCVYSSVRAGLIYNYDNGGVDYTSLFSNSEQYFFVVNVEYVQCSHNQ